ncbi:hypothetical protein CCACVL1_00665, partial [Corchorus capsularis]
MGLRHWAIALEDGDREGCMAGADRSSWSSWPW